MAAVTCGQDEPPSKVRPTGEAAGREAADEVHCFSLNSLPDELIINIFSFLSFNDIMDTVQNVCIKWKRLAHVPGLWLDKEYIYDEGASESEEVLQRLGDVSDDELTSDESDDDFDLSYSLMKSHIRNSSLQVRSCCGVVISQCRHCRIKRTDDEVLRDADHMPQLRALTVMGYLTSTVLRKICENCPHLTTLNIHYGYPFNYTLLKYIFQKCPKIQTLKLSKELLAKKLGIAELVSHLEHLKRLEILAEYGPFFDEPGVPVRVLADGCPRLEEIIFDTCSYPLADLDHFFKAKKHSITSATVPWTVGPREERMLVVLLLKQCGTTLRKLQLCNFDVPSGLTAAAFEALGELHNLHELLIKEKKSRHTDYLHERLIKEKKTRETDNISIVFRPGCLTQLRRIHVTSFPFFEDDTLLAISRNCANLRELTIDNVLITDEGLSEIHRLKHLEILEVSGCRGLGGAAVAHVSHLPALHTLVLQNFGTLSRLLPGLELIADMTDLRFLDILGNNEVECMPFNEFPHKLTKLRELHVPRKVLLNNNPLAELQNKMPLLKIFKGGCKGKCRHLFKKSLQPHLLP